jgi:hypothetical protein
MESNPLAEYRTRLLGQLLKSTEAFCAACRAARDPKKSANNDQWNIHQLAQHVRDVNAQSYVPRIRRTLAEDYPAFVKFDADAWAAGHYNADEPLEKILGELEKNVRDVVAELKAQPDSAWSRLGHHDIHGDRTLQIWVERSLEHIREHLETVKAGVKEG